MGKTSIAAATALWFAGQGKKVLIISTDPAHSLSDSFDTRIGGQVKKLGKNLFGVEIDPELCLQEYKARIMPQLDKIEYLRGMGLDGLFDMADTAPGVDEIAAFDKFLQYINSREYDMFVFDTAPTGHALRFLSLPDVLDSWVGKMIVFRMKFAGIANMLKKILPFGKPDEEPGMGTEQLQAMKKRIKQAKAVLGDPEKTKFWMVCISEQMAVLESERAIRALKKYKIPVAGIIVNQLIPESQCSFCRARKDMQDKNLASIRTRFKGLDIKEVQLFPSEVRGVKSLEKLGSLLTSKS